MTEKKLVSIIYETIFIWTNILIFFIQHQTNVSTSKRFLFDNSVLLLIGGCVVFLVFLLIAHFRKSIETFLLKSHRILLGSSIAFLLFWQLYSSFGGYFRSGWDVEAVRDTAILEYLKYYDHLLHAYYSWYPNNILLAWVFTNVVKISVFFGFTNWEFSLVAFQCIIDVITVWLTYQVAYRFTKNQILSWVAYVITYFFVGISPWFIVPYSDATGFIFPVLILWMYHSSKTERNRYRKMILDILTGAVSMAGFYIKPQVLIVFLAIILTELSSLFTKQKRESSKRLFLPLGFWAMGTILFWICYTGLIVPSLHLRIDPDQTMGWQHQMMMGLNKERDGVWASEDVAFTRSFDTNRE